MLQVNATSLPNEITQFFFEKKSTSVFVETIGEKVNLLNGKKRNVIEPKFDKHSFITHEPTEIESIVDLDLAKSFDWFEVVIEINVLYFEYLELFIVPMYPIELIPDDDSATVVTLVLNNEPENLE